MATARANITTKVGADTSEFSAAMRRVGAQAQGVAGRIGNSMKGAAASVARLGVAAASAGAAIAGAAASAALFKGVKGAAQIEQMGIAFEVMTGSAEKGKALLEEIRDFGTQTPYEFPALAQGAQTMMAFGVATEQVMPSLRMIGDIAAGDAEKMSSLSLAFGQIASTGRLMGQDLLQLINAGFNPLQEISAKTGESMAQLKKRMEDGGVSFDEVVSAFKAATSEGGRFFGMTDRQSRTFNGRMSSLVDSVNNALTTMGEPIKNTLTPMIADLTGMFEDMLPVFDAIGKNIAENIPKFIQGVWDAADGAYQFGQYLEKGLKLAGVILKATFSEDFWKAQGLTLGVALMDAVNKMKSGFDGVNAMIVQAFAELPNLVWNAFEFLMDPKVWEYVGDSLVRAANRFAVSMAETIFNISSKILSFDWSGLKSMGEKIAQGFNEELKTPDMQVDVGRTVADSMKRIRQAGADAAANSTPLFETDTLKAKIDSLMGGLRAEFGSILDEPIQTLGQAISGTIAKASAATKPIDQMQSRDTLESGLQRYSTIGQTGAFARDRARLGIASGLTTGGLGEKRRVGQGSADKVIRDTRSLQEKQVDHLESMDKTLKQAITVA